MGIISKANRFSVNAPGRGETVEVILNYDFATDAGAVGTIAMRGEAIPSGAILTDALIIVDTPATGGAGATIALTVESAADIQAAAVVTGSPWSVATAKRCSALTATAAPVVTTASRQPSIVVAVNDLTAGKFKLILKYVTYDSSVA